MSRGGRARRRRVCAFSPALPPRPKAAAGGRTRRRLLRAAEKQTMCQVVAALGGAYGNAVHPPRRRPRRAAAVRSGRSRSSKPSLVARVVDPMGATSLDHGSFLAEGSMRWRPSSPPPAARELRAAAEAGRGGGCGGGDARAAAGSLHLRRSRMATASSATHCALAAAAGAGRGDLRGADMCRPTGRARRRSRRGRAAPVVAPAWLYEMLRRPPVPRGGLSAA